MMWNIRGVQMKNASFLLAAINCGVKNIYTECQRKGFCLMWRELSLELLSELVLSIDLDSPIFPSHYSFTKTVNYFKTFTSPLKLNLVLFSTALVPA